LGAATRARRADRRRVGGLAVCPLSVTASGTKPSGQRSALRRSHP
jgi:hypothetical protein